MKGAQRNEKSKTSGVYAGRDPFEIRRDREFWERGVEACEQAPNYVQLKDLELGQMELF